MLPSTSILVLADDLTGAAEIAGIGIEYGLRAACAMLGAGPPSMFSAVDLLVIDTDSRPLSPDAAAARIADALRNFPHSSNTLIFKKVDSVLRGQIPAELTALLQVLKFPRALLVPQNPSKGRVILKGQYLIHGIPLDQTSFRDDPEYPRTTAQVLDLLRIAPTHMAPGLPGAASIASPATAPAAPPIHLANVHQATLPPGILIANAASATDIHHWAARPLTDTDGGILLAGGADLFRALLDSRGLSEKPRAPIPHSGDRSLVVCGSASDYSRNIVTQWQSQGLPVCLMHDDVFAAPADEASINRWTLEARTSLEQRRMAILAVPHAVAPFKALAIRNCMARTVVRLIEQLEHNLSIRLIIEGGATAAAIVSALGWADFEVAGNIAPGVVTLRPHVAPHVLMIIKPGSYPWPPNFPERT